MYRDNGDGLSVVLADYGERVMVSDLSSTVWHLRDRNRAVSKYSMEQAVKPWNVDVNSDLALEIRGRADDVGALIIDLTSAILVAGAWHRSRAAVDEDLSFDEQVAQMLERRLPGARVRRRPVLDLSETQSYRPSLTVTPNGHTAALQTLPAGGSTTLYVSEAYRTLGKVRQLPLIATTFAVLAGDPEDWPAREVQDLAAVSRVVSWEAHDQL
ncbi:MAG: hypothetical protein ACR2HR_18095, partial [Euzebya sp.]